MEKIIHQQKVLKWNTAFGLFEAHILDGQLTDFRACENGSIATICNSNITFLKEVSKALTELFAELDAHKTL